ncbi:MAG: hypothetical protein KatS3mg031_2033 [Chitinophagales bacterium]|nr:MAG: hypothetical protein KatS3mg031_2033 [Chitinophagales bacterium]
MKNILYSFILATASLNLGYSQAQNQGGYEIKVKINNLKNDTIYLAYHYGDKQYIKDTAVLDSKGIAVFKGPEKLPGGFYLIVYPNKNFFEIIVNEQRFYVENDTTDFQKNLKTSGSVENKIFAEDMAFISQKQKERQALENEKKAAEGDAQKMKDIQARLEALDKEVKNFRNKLAQNYPNSFYVKFLKSLEEVEIPEPPRDAEGKPIDSFFEYRYYKDHYFDNIDFTDDRMLRTPTFHKKVMTYLEKVVPQHPDSIGKYCDIILERSRPNPEMFKYWLITLLNYYAKSNIMCQEAVYVHLVENYYAKGDATWVSDDDLYRITDRAKKLKPTLCNRVAPNMYLRDLNNNLIPLHSIKAKYLMVYIYDPDCGHCKKETPKFVEAYKKIVDSMHIDFKVYAAPTLHLHKGEYDENKNPIFSNDPKDLNAWPDFVKQYHLERWINVADLYLQDNFRALYDINSTPQEFLLDADKKIIAKRFNAEQLVKIIEDLERRSRSN